MLKTRKERLQAQQHMVISSGGGGKVALVYMAHIEVSD